MSHLKREEVLYKIILIYRKSIFSSVYSMQDNIEHVEKVVQLRTIPDRSTQLTKTLGHGGIFTEPDKPNVLNHN